MDVRILLSDGTLGAIVLMPVDYPQKTDGRPVHLIPLQESSEEVRNAFTKASFAAHCYLRKNALVKPGECFAFAYEVTDDTGEGILNQMYGRSCELPIALSLIAEIRKDIATHGTAAASGVIYDAESGLISAVDALTDKLRGAITCLPDESRIFCPVANRDEVSGSFVRDAGKRNISLHHVSEIGEAAEYVLSPSVQPGRKLPFLAAALMGIYLLFFCSSYPLSVYCLENGQYEWAETYLSGAVRLFFWDKRLGCLLGDFRSRVHVKTRFAYLLQNGEENAYAPRKVPHGLSLSRYDSYALHILSRDPLYFYIYQTDTGGQVRILFPRESGADASLSEPENRFKFPRVGKGFFSEGYKGVMETCLIASRWRCRDIEEIFAEMRHDVWNPGWHTEALRKRTAARDRQGCGAVMERVVFWHE